jgi:hypothetical protein
VGDEINEMDSHISAFNGRGRAVEKGKIPFSLFPMVISPEQFWKDMAGEIEQDACHKNKYSNKQKVLADKAMNNYCCQGAYKVGYSLICPELYSLGNN